MGWAKRANAGTNKYTVILFHDRSCPFFSRENFGGVSSMGFRFQDDETAKREIVKKVKNSRGKYGIHHSFSLVKNPISGWKKLPIGGEWFASFSLCPDGEYREIDPTKTVFYTGSLIDRKIIDIDVTKYRGNFSELYQKYGMIFFNKEGEEVVSFLPPEFRPFG